uniref:Putative secreted protein n=1 Tax=Anopheles darlingi TaxID=43151 RepID=A0A2M4DER4_ANODA
MDTPRRPQLCWWWMLLLQDAANASIIDRFSFPNVMLCNKTGSSNNNNRKALRKKGKKLQCAHTHTRSHTESTPYHTRTIRKVIRHYFACWLVGLLVASE